MGERAEILIVGGGAIGCAIALELLERGARDVLIVDRGPLGSGSSAKAAGGLRAQFSTEINIRLTQLSQPFFREVRERLGVDIGWDEAGYIFIARSAEQAATFRANVALQQSLGVDVRFLTPDELEAGWPFLLLEGVHGGTFCGTDAVFDQVAFMDGLAGRARALGARVLEHVEVSGLLVEGERVRGVTTTAGTIEADVTVLAAGVWSPAIAAGVGLELPILAQRREIYTVVDVPGIPKRLPFLADFDRGAYVRRDPGGFRIAGQLAPSDDPDPSVDLARASQAIAWSASLIPALADVRVTGGWAGLTEVTPDHHALLGPVPGLDGLVIATGFSGHGIMHAPVTGVLVAELLLEGATRTLDIASLSPLRFREGRALTETMFARTVPTHEQGDIVVSPHSSGEAPRES